MPLVSLQINLAASDFRLSEHLLERQISLFSQVVDEVVFSLDVKMGSGRFAEQFAENYKALNSLLDSLLARFPKVRVSPVDYSEKVQQEVQKYFKQSVAIPLRDFRGGPCYVYFHGMWSCRNDFVLHLDADMFFGGRVGDWLQRALKELASPSVFSVAPMPGPPTTTGNLRQPILDHACIEENITEGRYVYDGFSTRIFLMNRRKICGIQLSSKPTLGNFLRALSKGLLPQELPEVVITRHMRSHGFVRVDLNSSEQLYSLHPPYKSLKFYENVTRILEAIDTDSIPEGQRGFYDMNDALYDFTEERRTLFESAWYRRIARNVAERFFGSSPRLPNS